MGLQDKIQKSSKVGFIASNDFPFETALKVGDDDNGNRILVFEYPNGGSYVVRHEMVRYAAILCIGVVGGSVMGATGKVHVGQSVPLYGVKYKAEFTDGKVAVITANIGAAERVEGVLF